MNSSILLVASETRWLGAARMPRALANAGFDVALLTPEGSLAATSRYVAKVGLLGLATTAAQWQQAFAAMVKATSPRVVMPCDDRSFRLMQALALSPPPTMSSALALQLGALLRESLGDPAHYRTSVSKTMLPAAAVALDVRVPAYRIVSRVEEAEAFAALHGYPVVLKREQSSAGDGVEICADKKALQGAMSSLLHPAAPARIADGPLLIQAHVKGRTKFYPTMAWRGRILTGYAGEKLVGNPEPKGPPTVNRYHRSPALREATEKLVAGFAISGFLSPEFIEDEATGTAYLIEINRRLVGGAHRGSEIGVDHCAALHAAVNHEPYGARGDLDDAEEHLTVHFPQEWLRDPASAWLTDHPVDVPWDDPELIDAMVALRHE